MRGGRGEGRGGRGEGREGGRGEVLQARPVPFCSTDYWGGDGAT